MKAEFDTSSERFVKIIRKPELSVVALKSFGVGMFKLVALAHNDQLQALKQPLSETDTSVDMVVAYTGTDGPVHCIAKNGLSFSKAVDR